MKMKDIKRLRVEVASIIKVNLELIESNPRMCQDVADAILMHILENEKVRKKKSSKVSPQRKTSPQKMFFQMAEGVMG